MLKFFTVLLFLVIFKVSAQTSSPNLINYQGVARDASGVPITTAFDIQFIIKDLTQVVHNETQNGIQPNALGLFTTKIGISPNFTYTAWGSSPLQLEVLIKAGPTFTQLGTQQLVSVPFSLFANDVRSGYNGNVLTIGANSYSIASGSAVTPTINGTGLVTVTPNTGPVYSVGVPTPSLNYVQAGNILTLTQGTFATSVPLTGAGNSTVNMLGTGLANVSPTSGSSFTVNVPNPTLNFSGNTLTYSQGTFVASPIFNPSTAGDVTGPISSSTVTAIRNTPVSSTTPLNNQVLTMVSGSWTPSTPAAIPATGWQKIGPNISLVTSSDNVGIGTAIPSGKLDVAGETVTDSIQITSPVAPVAGAHLLSRDNVGNTKWSPGPVAFQFQFAPFAAITVSTNVVSDLGNNIQFSGSQVVAIGGGFNTTNARFTAPVTGLYEFNGSLEILLNPAAAGNNWIYLEICKNPATPSILKRSLTNNHDASITTYYVLQVHTLVNLTAGEVVFLRADGNSGGTGGQITTTNQPNLINSFSGHLIR